MNSYKKVAELVFISLIVASLCVSSVYAVEKTPSSALSGIAAQAGSLAEGGSLGEMININSATPELLASIPGIGPQLGEAIVGYRQANGSFTEIKDLLNVKGIDMSLLEKIKPFLKF